MTAHTFRDHPSARPDGAHAAEHVLVLTDVLAHVELDTAAQRTVRWLAGLDCSTVADVARLLDIARQAGRRAAASQRGVDRPPPDPRQHVRAT